MKQFKTLIFSVVVILFSLAGIINLQAQSEKKTLTIEDVEIWRNHSVTLSGDGEWYTVLYSLNEEPESKKESTEENSDKKQKDIDVYGQDARTDVLYICHSKTGVKYQIPDGSQPKFSSASDWIAYQIKPKSDKKEEETEKEGEEEKEKSKNIIELKNLETGKTIQYVSDAEYQFTKDAGYFITSDKNSFLVYDLDHFREHYIGNIGEFLIDKKFKDIAYTINSFF